MGRIAPKSFPGQDVRVVLGVRAKTKKASSRIL